MPRHFAISPEGNWLLAANQMSNRIELFRIDPESGRFTPEARGVAVSRPVCLLWLSQLRPPDQGAPAAISIGMT
jgi:6-phosphogluconolactonase